MTAREKQYVPGNPPHSANNSVRPGADLLRRFASWTTVSEQVPVRTFGTDVDAAAALKFAVIPLNKVGIDLRDGTIPGQFACAARSLQWTRKHLCQKQSLKTLTEFPSVPLPKFGQWEVRKSRMLPGQAPSRLTMPRDVDNGKFVFHCNTPLP